MKNIILASKSPRRKELLAGMGVKFTVETAGIGDENRFFADISDIESAIIALAQAKNAPISNKFPDTPVLSADTIVIIDDKVVGKPKDRADAGEILRMLSGRTHFVLTAVNLVYKTAQFNEFVLEKTAVQFKEIGDDELERYLDEANYLDKAGAYGIQEHGLFFVEKIEGCYSNIVGLPVSATEKLLRKLP